MDYMNKISELKEIIVSLKMDLIEAKIPKGYCPYSYGVPSTKREIDCSDCEKCRRIFMKDMEKDIRTEIEEL